MEYGIKDVIKKQNFVKFAQDGQLKNKQRQLTNLKRDSFKKPCTLDRFKAGRLDDLTFSVKMDSKNWPNFKWTTNSIKK